MGQRGPKPGFGGRPRKPLSDKILDGNHGKRPLTVIEFKDSAVDLEGQVMPKPSDFLSAKQKDGSTLCAAEIYENVWRWLAERKCATIVSPQLIERYAMASARWIQCESITSELGFLAKHPTTGAAIQSPYVAIANTYMTQATLFEPKAYGICSKDSNAMKSDNPHSGIYEADTSRTIDGNGGNPCCNQGGIAVVESYALQGSMIGRKDENGPQGDGINEDVSFTLNTVDRHAVFAMTTGCYTQVVKDISPTLAARDYKDAHVVTDPIYSVRRLMPTECARLQGFPDWWCDDLGTENPTDGDIAYWTDVWETHRKITNPDVKPKTQKQIIKWLKSPHSDSAEYKMWGNGVALPNVVFVLSGIVWSTQHPAG